MVNYICFIAAVLFFGRLFVHLLFIISRNDNLEFFFSNEIHFSSLVEVVCGRALLHPIFIFIVVQSICL